MTGALMVRNLSASVAFGDVTTQPTGIFYTRGKECTQSRGETNFKNVIPAKAGTQSPPVLKVRTSARPSFQAVAGAGFPLARE
jgi:uncharacterized protein YigE (DUF2233 family)